MYFPPLGRHSRNPSASSAFRGTRQAAAHHRQLSGLQRQHQDSESQMGTPLPPMYQQQNQQRYRRREEQSPAEPTFTPTNYYHHHPRQPSNGSVRQISSSQYPPQLIANPPRYRDPSQMMMQPVLTPAELAHAMFTPQFEPSPYQVPATALSVDTLSIYVEPSEYFLQASGSLELLLAMLGMRWTKHEVTSPSSSVTSALRRVVGGNLIRGFPVWAFDNFVMTEMISAARYIAIKFGLYGKIPESDVIADTMLAYLENWREYQTPVLAEATKWLLREKNRAPSSQPEPLPPVIVDYLTEYRPGYYKSLFRCTKSWHLLYRDARLSTSWIDPLIFGRIVDDRLLDDHLNGVQKLSFQTANQLMAADYGVISDFFNTMYSSHRTTMGPIIGAKVEPPTQITRPPADLSNAQVTTDCSSSGPSVVSKVETPVPQRSNAAENLPPMAPRAATKVES